MKQKFVKIFSLVGAGYVLLRFGVLVKGVGIGTALVEIGTLLTSAISRLVAVLLTGVTQTIFPQELILALADRAVQLSGISGIPVKGNPAYDVFLENQLIRPVMYVFGPLTLAILVFYAAKQKGTKRVAALSSLLLFVVSLVPLAFIPSGELSAVFLAPRGLYLPTAGSAVLFGLMLKPLLKRRSKSLALILVYLVMHFSVVRMQVNHLTEQGQEREKILRWVQIKYPSLPDKVIFYTESDSSFYGISPRERIMPFQSGFGQTLLVWYHPSENFPKEFFANQFLWGITDEGYKQSLSSGEGKEADERGFGYFRDFESLAKTLAENDIKFDSVIAFRYDSSTRTVEDMTQEVRGRLEGYFADKQEIGSEDFFVSASENKEDARLAVDGLRETFWRSEVAYKPSQFFELNLKLERKIAQITIDSYNNKDQNKVGYRILLSNDGQSWREAFYAKRYPPEESGLINIYIKPQKARYLRIEQLGLHKFAPWVIHELKIYEAL